MTSRTLNLRSYNFEDPSNIPQEVELILDSFIAPFLQRRSVRLIIIVGKGIGSRRTIGGKNPLRYYTERYLNALQLPYRQGAYHEGQEGVIIVEF